MERQPKQQLEQEEKQHSTYVTIRQLIALQGRRNKIVQWQHAAQKPPSSDATAVRSSIQRTLQRHCARLYVWIPISQAGQHRH